jgi:hypothetical protein
MAESRSLIKTSFGFSEKASNGLLEVGQFKSGGDHLQIFAYFYYTSF